MARLALKAFAAALLFATPLHAQQARVVTACGSLAPFGPTRAGGQAYPTMDTNGRLCLSGGGGGGGGSITANSTPTSGFSAGQLLMSDGALTQAVGPTIATQWGNATAPLYVAGYPAVNTLNFTTALATPPSWGIGFILKGSEIGISLPGANTPGAQYFMGFNNADASNYKVPDIVFSTAGTAIAAFRDEISPTSSAALRVYNTRTDASNGEWAALDWQTTPNVLTIGTQKNGTGTGRAVNLVATGLQMNGTTGVTCSGAPTASFATVNGIVTHC